MKIFRNKFLVKLIASICLFLTLLNLGGTSKVYAKEDDKIWGGVLITPIIDLMVAIGDSIIEILHDSVQEQRQALIRLDGSDNSTRGWALFGSIVVGIVVAVAFIAAVVVTGGAIVAAATAIGIGATFTLSLRSNCR